MRGSIYRFVLLLLTGLTPVLAASQDPVFSQFYSSPIQQNPAFAGIAGPPNFALMYRNQWPSLNNAYQTYAFAYDQYFDEFNSGVGFSINSDNAGGGILKTNRISAIYAYRVMINRNWQVRWGIEAGFIQTRLDWNKLVFPDQLDPEFGAISPGGMPLPSEETPPDDLDQWDFDIGTGGLIYNERMYFGISMKHLNTPGQSYYDINRNLTGGLPIRWTLQAGAEFPILPDNNRRWGSFVSPSLMFVSQGASRQLNVGTFVGFGDIYGGVWYRHANANPDAVIGAVGFRAGAFRITYSYDATISQLSLRSGGSHELSMNITLTGGAKESIYNDCFGMFR